MNSRLVIFFIGLQFCFASCSHQSTGGQSGSTSYYQEGNRLETSESQRDQVQSELAVLWFQTSGEAKALFIQGYQLAEQRLSEILAQKIRRSRPLAVVLDLDETVLDNSSYQVEAIKSGKGYPYRWSEWIEKARAPVLPGARRFLEFAQREQVEIFYISNRKVAELDATIRNLEWLKLPFKKENIFLRSTESSKETRRFEVLKTHQIALLLGDNLGDFAETFDKRSIIERAKEVKELHHEFGNRFIVFPNPMYGDWEGAAYKYNFSLTPGEKQRARIQMMKGF